MILDSSALVAIIFHEPEAERLLVAIERASTASMGGPTLTEAGIVIGSRLGFESRDLVQLLAHFEVNIVPFEYLHGEEALRAYEKFGEGRLELWRLPDLRHCEIGSGTSPLRWTGFRSHGPTPGRLLTGSPKRTRRFSIRRKH